MKILVRLLPIAVMFALTPILTGGQAASSPTRIDRDTQASPFIVVGMAVRTDNQREAGDNGEIPKLWQQMLNDKLFDRIQNRADQNMIAVYSDYETDQTGPYNYTLGVRVTSVGNLPEGFVAQTVLPGPYAVVHSEQGSPYQVVSAVWRRIWQMSPAEMGGRRAFKTDYEIYPQGSSPESVQMEVHLGLRPEGAMARGSD